MRHRKAEIGEHSITHKSCNVAPVAANGTATTALEFMQDLSQVLGIKLRRQSSRTHDVAKRNGKLSPSGFGVANTGKRSHLIDPLRCSWRVGMILCDRL